MCRDRIGRQEVVASVVEHLNCELLYDRLSLDVQVSNHRVAVPTAEHLDDIEVDLAAKEGHGAASSERPSANVRGRDAGAMEVGGCGGAELFGCVGGRCSDTAVPQIVVCGNRFVARGRHSTVVEEAANCCSHWTAEVVVGAAM